MFSPLPELGSLLPPLLFLSPFRSLSFLCFSPLSSPVFPLAPVSPSFYSFPIPVPRNYCSSPFSQIFLLVPHLNTCRLSPPSLGPFCFQFPCLSGYPSPARLRAPRLAKLSVLVLAGLCHSFLFSSCTGLIQPFLLTLHLNALPFAPTPSADQGLLTLWLPFTSLELLPFLRGL